MFVGKITVFECVKVIFFDLSDAELLLGDIPGVDLVADYFLGVGGALFFAKSLLNSTAFTDEGKDRFWVEWEWLEFVGSVDVFGVTDE
jgi:hypothetical protein